MSTWTAAKVRETFIKYFIEEHGHTLVPSSRVVPENDPTLLFTNAGMNQFKNILLGKEDPSSKLYGVKRAVNTQKCIRAGGKHNDLEDVGRDTYHHTFFEMLGSWSFGDYFKNEAIPMAWDLLTSKFGISPDRLYVTVFAGDKEVGLQEDSDSYEIWAKFVPEKRILKCGMKDNFWEMGETGPCGRSTEIHYDMIGGRDACQLVNQDDPSVVELWNLVFVEYNRDQNGKLQQLPVKHVDTGMGFERLLAVLQGKQSNYDTDIWNPIFKRIQSVTASLDPYKTCEESQRCSVEDEQRNIAYRVVADHIRTLTMAIIDGATPESTGRGYVLRRIIRRAIRFGHEFLDAPQGFLIELLESVQETLGEAFSDLKDQKLMNRVKALLSDEQKAFYKTYKLGLKHFESILANMSLEDKSQKNVISGSDAFILHDRYGFPVDLTLIMANEKGAGVDLEAFEAEKLRSKNRNSGKTDEKKDFLDNYAIHYLQSNKVQTTSDELKYMVASDVSPISKVLEIFSQKQSCFIENASNSEGTIGIILDATSFYAESGGQIYDTGIIRLHGSENTEFQVLQVYKFGGYTCHIGSIAAGCISVNDQVHCMVDAARRMCICKNHTMTHILNHKLRDILQFGKPDKCLEVHQKGSFVGENILRFDFSWSERIEANDISLLDDALQKAIQSNMTIYSREVSIEEALNIHTLRAIFDEKYGKTVRVVSIGMPIEKILSDPRNDETLKTYSIELCGGTHVCETSTIQSVVILSEEALTKGVRRIVCATGIEAEKSIECGKMIESRFEQALELTVDKQSFGPALQQLEHNAKELSKIRADLNASQSPLGLKLKMRIAIDNEISKGLKVKKEITNNLLKRAATFGLEFSKSIPDGSKYIFCCVKDEFGANRDALLKVHSAILEASSVSLPVAVVLYCSKLGSGLIMASSPSPMDFDALAWVRFATGKGGGKASLAQGGLQGDLEIAIEKAKEFADKNF